MKFSLIIPVYNTDEQMLTQAVESCLQQTESDLEVILVDDGSAESCARLCDTLALRDRRIQVIHQENQGVSAARNHGIDCACGDWILCVDSDDWLLPHALETISHTITHCSKELDLVLFSARRVYGDGQQDPAPMYPNGKLFCGQGGIRQLQRDVLFYPLQNNILVFPYCKAIRRSVCQQMQPVFPEGVPMCEDVLSAFRLLDFVGRAVYLAEPLYCYRQAAESAVYRYRSNADREQLLFLRLLLAQIRSEPDPQQYLPGFCREVFYAAQRIITQKYFHRDATIPYGTAKKECRRLFAKEPFRTALQQVDPTGLSLQHRLKLLLIRQKQYRLCADLRKLYYLLPGRTV